jgi:hypothetical protein
MAQDPADGAGKIVKRLLFVFSLGLCASALAEPPYVDEDDPYALPPWVESDYTLPAYPKDENLVEFNVDGAPNLKAYVDKTAIGAGTPDSVIRYILVVKTNGGAVNVSYEGVRCDTSEYRIYATGTQEKTWSKARVSEWRRFKIYNQAQKSLANNYFCPNFVPIGSAREGLNALREGVHPAVGRRNYF